MSSQRTISAVCVCNDNELVGVLCANMCECLFTQHHHASRCVELGVFFDILDRYHVFLQTFGAQHVSSSAGRLAWNRNLAYLCTGSISRHAGATGEGGARLLTQCLSMYGPVAALNMTLAHVC